MEYGVENSNFDIKIDAEKYSKVSDLVWIFPKVSIKRPGLDIWKKSLSKDRYSAILI